VAKDAHVERRRYSFVDVLERVTDGVHVQIVARATDDRHEPEHVRKHARRHRADSHSRRTNKSRRR
jgi:hypothetical protein